MIRTVTLLSLASLSLIGCSSSRDEENELPEVLVEGAADSWSHPTNFGTLFQSTWQYGELSPSKNIRNVAFTFEVDDDASIEITTREAPFDEHERELSSSVVYLYKQQDNGSFRRIAKTEANDDFGVLARDIDAGLYRVLVKGVEADDRGEFMIRLGCEGDGCADGPQCLFGSDYYTVSETRFGALDNNYRSVLKATSNLSAAGQQQVIVAVNVASNNVSTIADAFAAVDDNEINRDQLLDRLTGRAFYGLEYGAGDNSFGAIFEGNNPQPVAEIHDGEIAECKVFAQSCVFGRQKGEAAYMPDMKTTAEHAFSSASEVPAALEAQLLAAVATETATPTLAEVFESVDDNTVWVTTFRHTDGREFVSVDYYSGDTSVGAFFAKGQTQKLGEISDGDVTDCKAY